MAINGKRVWCGGLVAGLIIVLSAGLMVPVVGTEMDGVLRDRGLPPLGTSAIVYFPLLSIALGLLMVWLYAAVLPRLGPGPRTAAVVAVVVWFLGNASNGIAMLIYGFMPLRLSVIGMAWGLAELVIAAQVGCRLYRDE